MKEKIDNFLQDLKQDKKKMFLLVLLFILLLGVIILTVIGKNTSETVSNDDLSTVIVPVDDNEIDNDNFDGKETKSNEFYTPTGSAFSEDYFDTIQSIAVEPERVIKPERKVPSRNGYTQPPERKENTKHVVSPVPVVASVVESQDNNVNSPKRKRAPSDGFGNVNSNTQSTASVNSNQLYGGVIDNNNALIRAGSNVIIRITEDIVLDSHILPRNSIVSGKATLDMFRMNITITSVKVGNSFVACKIQIYDEDGVMGLRLPESLVNELAKDVASEGISKTGATIQSDVPVVGRVKVGVNRRNQEASFIANTGHRIYLKLN